MGASGGSSGRHSWPDLHPEMLGVVLSRLPSHADRVRVAAVCRSWRSSARLLRPLPALLPWLALCDGTFLSLPDGAVHRLPVADDVYRRVSTGSALFHVHIDDGKCSLMNPSPVTTIPVPEAAGWFRDYPIVRKVLMSDHHVAALVEPMVNTYIGPPTTKAIVSARGQPRDITRCSTTEWAGPEERIFVHDIALFKGKLYVLLDTGYVLNGQEPKLRTLDDDGHGQTTIPGTRVLGLDDIFDPDVYLQRHYLVVSGNRLLMVQRRINLQLPMLPIHSRIERRTRLFKVFEATGLSSSGCGLWTEVDTLMGRALLVSEGCSQSLPAGDQSCAASELEETCENPFLDSGVYNMTDQTVTSLLPDTVVVPTASLGPWSLTWLFPET